MNQNEQEKFDATELLIPTKREHSHKHREKRHRKRRWWKVLLAILACLLALIITIVAVSIPLAGGLSNLLSYLGGAAVKAPAAAIIEDTVQTEPTLDEEEVEVTPDLPPEKEVQNIALFGIDQEKGTVGRSDAILILSIDRVNNKIKMITLDRDSLVAIDGHGEEKLTHAWAYGHGPLAVKTLNQNFGMNITDYAYVNFTEFVAAIDYLGGVYVDVTAAERDHMNQSYNSWDDYYGYYIPKVEGTGRVLLKGAQALSYARNRSDGGSQRGGRQREVLLAMYEQVKAQPVTKWPGMFKKLLGLCHTTMSGNEIMDIAYWALTSSPEIESLSLPNSQLQPWGGVIDRQRGWVRVYDLEAATTLLYNFIYETDEEITGVTQYSHPGEKEEETATTTTSSGE